MDSRRRMSGMLSSRLAAEIVDDISNEIIIINKEPLKEASIALDVGFPSDFLTNEEINFGVVSEVEGIEQINYVLIRNHLIRMWRDNVCIWLTKDMFVDTVPVHCQRLLDAAYDYLVLYGYINFGVAPKIKERISVEPTNPSVIVVGAGLAGLGAARQLMANGFAVLVLEGRSCAGGRVYSKMWKCGNKAVAVDFGGSVITGIDGNPLGVLARQLSLQLHKMGDKCPLYGVDGTLVDPDLDKKVEASYNQLLDKLNEFRLSREEDFEDIPLGTALWRLNDFPKEEINLYNWHVANLEFANSSLVSQLSLKFWDQDDKYELSGDHCLVSGGNGLLVRALAENVPIRYQKTVQAISYDRRGVQVTVAGGRIYKGDMVLCTVPLGVLKHGTIKFIPELPRRKLDSIRRLGFGLLNKVALLFPHAFWGTEPDTFGHLSDYPSPRGEFFLFYNCAKVAGGALLIAFVAGEAAERFEAVDPVESVHMVLRILRGIFERQCIEVPYPVKYYCTRWGADPFSRGSYSSVAVGASGLDYDILDEPVGDGRVFFAGEATSRQYPASMHGALLSGFREAAKVAQYARSRRSSSQR